MSEMQAHHPEQIVSANQRRHIHTALNARVSLITRTTGRAITVIALLRVGIPDTFSEVPPTLRVTVLNYPSTCDPRE